MKKINSLIKLQERLYVLPYRQLGDRPNLYYINGDDYSVSIDAGNSRQHLESFYEALEEANLKLPRYTIISHWHWDHSFALPYINGLSISSKMTYDKLLEVSKWKWDKASMLKRLQEGLDIQFCNDNIIYEYKNLDDIKVITTNEYIDEYKQLDLGGIKLDLIVKGSTHSDDSLFVYCKDLKALFVQDADWIDPYVSEEYDQEKLRKMIDFFESLDYEFHYLGHVAYETKRVALKRLKNELK